MTTDTEWASRRAMTRRRLLATATGMAAGTATGVATGRAGARTAGAAGVAGAGAQTAQAEPQTSKQDADYRDAPRNGRRCAGCVNFLAPEECKRVRGRVSPTGSCRLWKAPPARRDS